MHCGFPPSRQRGLSTIEVLVVLGITCGSLYFAVPAAGEAIHSAELSAASDEFLSDVHLARTEALKRNRRVSLCKSPDGVQCVKSGGWDQGWMIFQDEDRDGLLDGSEEVLVRHAALPHSVRVTGNQPVASYISYTPLGATKLSGGAFQAGTITVCRRSAGPTASRKVVLNAIGRPRVERSKVDSCG